jgi:Rrf2 family protein
VLYLAQHSREENKIGAKELADKIHVPHHFLAKILQDLSRKKVISSTKGPNGGFFLTDENQEQNLLTVIEEIDGMSWYDDCAFGLEECSGEHPCPVHHIFQPLRNQLYEDLRTQSIKQFADQLESGKVYIGGL